MLQLMKGRMQVTGHELQTARQIFINNAPKIQAADALEHPLHTTLAGDQHYDTHIAAADIPIGDYLAWSDCNCC